MSEMRPEFDLLIKNVSVVRPQKEGLLQADIAVKDGRIVKVAPGIDAGTAAQVFVVSKLGSSRQ